MRLWAILAALLLSSLVLAGCSDDDGDDGDATSSGTTTSGSGTSGTTTPGTTSSASGTTTSPPGEPGQEPANTAPAGQMAVVPVGNHTANFTLNGTDPEGDNIVWDLFFGDGQSTSGSVLPANASHQYATAGFYNASFTISDGRLQTTYNVTVNATAGSGGGGATGVVITGSTTAPGNPLTSGGIGANGCAGFNAGDSGVDCVFGEIPAGLDGHPFLLESDGAAPDYALWDACDPTGTVVQADGGPAAGTLPAGVGCVVMWEYGPGTATFTFTVS